MPEINTETTYRIELTASEQDRISRGHVVDVDLPGGDSIRLTGSPEGPTEGDGESVTEEDIEELVEEGESQQRLVSDKGTGGEESGNPETGGMIDIERTGE